LCILGDLTDSKDYHPSSLTNRIVEQITRFSSQGIRVIILMGNHDYLRAGHAYFDFLNRLPNVTFVSKPWEDMLDNGAACLWLPHTKTPTKDWEGIDTTHFNYVFMHQTVGGAIASNGMEMADEGVPDMTAWGKVYSGDIHVPQVIKGVEYVGSPYHVHFGDNFKPRVLLLDRRGRPVDFHFESPRRLSLKADGVAWVKNQRFKPGDQVKLEVMLHPGDKHQWLAIRREILEHLKHEMVELHDISMRIQPHTGGVSGIGATTSEEAVRLTDEQAVERFVRWEDLGGEVLDMGLEFIK
jgi:hypothetical protein